MTGLVMATMMEAKPLIAGFSLAEIPGPPFKVFSGSRMVLVVSGIGKVSSALATLWLIQNFRPDCICNIGAAGALDGRKRLGEFFHINRVIEPDRPDLETGLFSEQIPDILDGFPLAALATHDRPLRLSEERSEIAGSADLVDMEGAAILMTARLMGLRCFLFKFVSDTPEHESRGSIIENIKRLRDVQMPFFEDRLLPALQKSGNPNR